MKICPRCGKKDNFNDFCGECGTKLEEIKDGMNIGDKNVIAGDVIGKKEETNISGNATIIKNEDETKKTEKCHVCGSIITKVEGYVCPSCGNFVCSECYNKEKSKCKNCVTKSGNEKEDVYKQALVRALEDERIDMTERKELMALQNQLGISAMRAMELEKIVKSEIAEGKNTAKSVSLSTFDKISFDKAIKLLYEEGNAAEAIKLLDSLYNKYSTDETILEAYLNAMVKVYPDTVVTFIKNLQADVLCTYLAEIDTAFLKEDYSAVEELITKAEKFWPDSKKLACRHVKFYLTLATVSGDSSYLMVAKELLESCGTGTDKLEKSIIASTNIDLLKALDEQLPDITPEYCEKNGLYKSFFDIAGYKLSTMSEQEILKLDTKELGKAAEAGNSIAQYYYGKYWKDDRNNNIQAIDWFRKSADENNNSLLELCDSLFNDIYDIYDQELYGLTPHYMHGEEEYVEWAKKAVSKNIKTGYRLLGYVYEWSYGTDQNLEEALNLYKKGIEAGDGFCNTLLENFLKLHPEYNTEAVKGDSLRYDLTISSEEAANGTTANIKFKHLEVCDTCNGKNSNNCSACNGSGLIEKHKSMSLKIPAGTESGKRIVINEMGDAGKNGGPAGDLYVVIKVEAPKNTQNSDDIFAILAGCTNTSSEKPVTSTGETCTKCNGTGKILKGFFTISCTACHGTGKL